MGKLDFNVLGPICHTNLKLNCQKNRNGWKTYRHKYGKTKYFAAKITFLV